MVVRASHDHRYLERIKGNRWRVTVSVPKPLHTQLGTKLKRSLHTSSLRDAQRLRWPIVAELQGIISRGAPRDDAEAWKAAMAASTGEPDDPTELILHDHLDDIRGDPIATEADEHGRPPSTSTTPSGRGEPRT
jgi:hypothetical protein